MFLFTTFIRIVLVAGIVVGLGPRPQLRTGGPPRRTGPLGPRPPTASRLGCSLLSTQ